MQNQYSTAHNPSAYEPAHATAEKKHSGFGIASFAMALTFAIGLLALVITAGVIETNTPGGMDEESTTAIIIGLLLFAGVFAEILALILGIVGVAQSSRKKVFGILGICVSMLTMFCIAALMVIGMTAG